MTCILVDDELISLQALEAKIKMIAPDVHILGMFQQPQEALKAIEKEKPNVLFLDIDMPEMDGFALLKNNSYKDVFIIFTTAHSQYAIEAIRAEATDFLTKPVDIEELALAFERVKIKLNKTPKVESKPLSTTPAFINIAHKIPVTSTKGVQFVSISDIIWLKSDSNYTTLFLANNKTLVATKNLKDFEETLEPLGFLRVHHSSLINTIHIIEYRRGEGGTLILTNNHEVDVSKRKKSEVLEYLGL